MRGKIGLASLALLLLSGSLAHADPLQIRGAWVAPIANWVSIWLRKKDLAQHFGKSYIFEAGAFRRHAADDHGDRQQRAGDRRPRLFHAADRDRECRAWTTSASSPTNSRTAFHGYRDDEFEVLTDGPIKKVEDLKGKVVATNAVGSGVDVAMRAMLRKHGLEANRDYTVDRSAVSRP